MQALIMKSKMPHARYMASISWSLTAVTKNPCKWISLVLQIELWLIGILKPRSAFKHKYFTFIILKNRTTNYALYQGSFVQYSNDEFSEPRRPNTAKESPMCWQTEFSS